VRTWKLACLLLLAACGRSELLLLVGDGDAAESGRAGAPAAVGGKAGGSGRAEMCPTPATPVAFPEGCAQTLCACDREAFSNCDWNCWSRIACQVATCNNNPTRSECAEGCANATRAELKLGHCYISSKPCIATLPGVPR
jgi:hypothetical protein